MQKMSESSGTCVPGSLAKLTIFSGPRAIEQAQLNQRLKIIAKKPAEFGAFEDTKGRLEHSWELIKNYRALKNNIIFIRGWVRTFNHVN